jgi:hypothetical protein
MVLRELPIAHGRDQRTNRERIEQNALSFRKAFDHRSLVLIDPARDGEPENLKVRRHGNKQTLKHLGALI